MLIGEYTHTIDSKNRMSLPVKFRKVLGKIVIITPGLDNCLFVFTLAEWSKVSKKLGSGDEELSFLKSDQRTFNRNMFGQAVDVEVDSIGRILIPDFLKELADLKNTGAIIGVQDRLEIWNDKVWQEYKKMAGKQAESLAEKLGGQKE
ncbi:MAG TPA: division/cell wall cluster transcriptional repressor MraZ [Candidatus Paceibacterota bacterium]|jgi:MraZ protein|nr:division/cell wall cluster transcriptional repressor MraZ [Candidatus Paceibacterota bacterium]